MAGKAHLMTGFVVLVAAAVLIALYFRTGLRPEHKDEPILGEKDSRLTFPAPYRNTRPEAAYVSDQTCADCHADKAEAFHKHPMGRSLAPVASVAGEQRYDASVHNPFNSMGAEFTVERRGNQIFHKESRRDAQGKVFAEARKEIQYVIGSGVHNFSYLIE